MSAANAVTVADPDGRPLLRTGHVDDLLQFPLPEHVEAHSQDAPPPIFIISLFVLLTDVDSIEDGCTCFVP